MSAKLKIQYSYLLIYSLLSSVYNHITLGIKTICLISTDFFNVFFSIELPTLGVTTTWLVFIDLFRVFLSLALDNGWALSITLLFSKHELPVDIKLDVLLALLIGADLECGLGLKSNQINSNTDLVHVCNFTTPSWCMLGVISYTFKGMSYGHYWRP